MAPYENTLFMKYREIPPSMIILSNMQKITCATFNGYSLMIASFYQKLRKLFFEHY